MTTTEFVRPLVRRGFLKWSAIVFALLLVVLAFNIWDFIETRRLNATIAALVRNGEQIREPYRTLKGNAADADRMYRAAATLAEGLYSEMPTGLFSRLGNAERDRNWPPELLSQVRSMTDRHREAIAMGLRAAALPFEGFAPGTSGQSMQYLNTGLVNLTRGLGLEAAMRAFDGDAERALDALVAETRIGKVSPIFSPIRVATDFRTVAERVRLPAAGLARLDGVVEGFDLDDRPKRALRRLRSGMLRDWQFRRSSFDFLLGIRVAPPWFVHEVNRQAAIFTKLVNAADGPWPQCIDRVVAVDEWPEILGRSPAHDVLEAFMVQNAQDLAIVRAIRFIIAIERYRRDHGEQPPAGVDELVPDYLAALPIDPFTGKPLMMTADAAGYVVYSAGADRRDDSARDLDLGFASPTAWPRGTYTADTGIRIRYR